MKWWHATTIGTVRWCVQGSRRDSNRWSDTNHRSIFFGGSRISGLGEQTNTSGNIATHKYTWTFSMITNTGHPGHVNSSMKNYVYIKIIVTYSVADPGGPGARAPLTPIFEAPDYILRPKLRIFRADQSCPPPPGKSWIRSCIFVYKWQ